ESCPAFYQLVMRQALTLSIAQPDQQWGDSDNPHCGRREPKAPYIEKRHCRFDKVDGNHRAGRGDSRSNRSRCKEPQNTAHILQLEHPPEPLLKQPSREEGLHRVKDAEGDGEPRVPPNRKSARDGRDKDGSSHWQACPGTKGDQRAY